MSPRVLNLIFQALDAHGEAVFSREEIADWPPGDFDEALREGLLAKTAPADEVVCPGCEDACLEEVLFLYGATPKDTRARVVCGLRDDIAPVPIPLEMLDRWAVSPRQVEKLRPTAQKAPVCDAGVGASDEAAQPDEKGFVRDPSDPSAYLSASKILNEHTPPPVATTDKQLKAILRRHPEVRKTRPRGRDGEPRPNRLNVHLTDWCDLVEKLQASSADGDGWPNVSDEEAAVRKAAIRRTKEPRQ